ncbi:Pectin acetylesterase 11 [Striga hermonthica]|uniref:Pectin acetylesterase n=1 Tax=Striga hermonthica TaxID=68872 RepID=A0A9N7RJ37_STRHE|nr:Pectin acetylesterase 11 [Striga hermonthica]
MADEFSRQLSICLFIVVLINAPRVRSEFATLTYLDSAVSKGAVCLNGGPPGYYLLEGSGSGVNNWMIYLEGGAWCPKPSECLERSKGWLGDVYSRPQRAYFEGMLDNNKTYNPDFYNWNKVNVVYCDGSSFLGDVEEVDPQTNVTYRGSRVFDAVVDDLLAKGLNNAENVILSGSSAGALATILHCDTFSDRLPNVKRVKCLADSGFFLHA